MRHPGPAFRWLLRLLPASFREEYGDELLRTWRDQMAEARPDRPGTVWRRALVDTLWVAPGECARACRRNAGVAARRLRRSPAFFLAAVATLALGVGATTAVFTVLNAVLLRPLPFADPARVGLVWALPPAGDPTWLSHPELEDLPRLSTGVEEVAGLTDVRLAHVAAGRGEEVQGLAVSHGLLRLLGVAPAIGRGFAREDYRPGAAPVVLVSDAFWRRRFGGDPGLVGRTLALDGRDYRVVGVLPASFALLPASSVLPEQADVWVPLEPHLASRQRSVRFLHALVRLRPDATFAAADAELRARGAAQARAFPDAYPDGAWTFTVVPFERDVLKQARPVLWLLFGLVGLVLLMACVNVTHLLLARDDGRRADLAVRTALGASAAQIAGEQLAESGLIAACAALPGVAVAFATPAAVRAIDPAALPRLAEAAVDGRVLLFAAALVALTAALPVAAVAIARCWLGPPSIAEVPRGMAGPTRAGGRLGHGLVVLQAAAATAILAVALFLADGLAGLERRDLGVAADGLVTARLSRPPHPPNGLEATPFFEQATAAVAAQPAVAGAAAISQLPLSGAMLGSTLLADDGGTPVRIDVDLRAVTPGYFAVAGTAVVAGRGFDGGEAADGPRVAIVDETLARRLAPDGRAIGRRVRWIRQPDVEITIVGIAAAVRHRGPTGPAQPTLYRPLRQYPRQSMYLVTRPRPGRTVTHAELRAAVATVDPTQPVADVATMAARRDRALARPRTGARLATTLAGLAVALGSIGLYGVIAFAVARRRREFAVRLAIGASPAAIRRQVLGHGLVPVAIGIALGIAGAAGALEIARGVVPAGDAHAGPACAAAIAIVAGCAWLALWPQARRAAQVDPRAALQAE